MASTPMDLDTAESSTPAANGTPAATSLNITRTLGGTMPSTSAIADIIASFRPTKVPSLNPKTPPVRSSKKHKNRRPTAGAPSTTTKPGGSQASQIAADAAASSTRLREPTASSQNSSHKNAMKPTVSDSSSQLFRRDGIKEGRPQPHILSLDYDDPGELIMTSESDETIQIYKVRDGRHEKQLLSKKYGVKLAKFTHTSSSIIYASTKQNDAIRYLTTHDNSFVRYFEGHEGAVTCLAMHPGADDFISCSKDNTVRLWNASTKNATGLLYLNTPYLSAFDPSGQVFAVASPSSGTVLLYDHRNFDKAPFATFDVVESCAMVDTQYLLRGWTKLDFSNDGRSVLLGTKGPGHFLLDSFNGTLKAYLAKPENRTTRLAAGEDGVMNGSSSGGASIEGSGECCFTPDGRYVIGGTKKGVVIWDTLGHVDDRKILQPIYVLDDTREAAVVAFNPRFNFFATADQDLVFWVPDPHA